MFINEFKLINELRAEIFSIIPENACLNCHFKYREKRFAIEKLLETIKKYQIDSVDIERKFNKNWTRISFEKQEIHDCIKGKDLFRVIKNTVLEMLREKA